MSIGLFAFGACLGSFLNVCIYRLPRERSVVRPRSFCPHCTHPIVWYDNIPIASYCGLRGRCRHCHQPIHWRYPVVEVLTGVAVAGLWWGCGWTWHFVVAVCLTAALIVTSAVDLEFRIIPDEISLGGLGAGLIASALLPAIHGAGLWWEGLLQAVLGAAAGSGSLYLTGFMGNMLFKKRLEAQGLEESMGLGDVKLLAMAGSVIGWKLALVAFLVAPFLAIVPGLVMLISRKSHEIPYGPFLAGGILIAYLWGTELMDWLGWTSLWQVWQGRI